MSSFVKYGQNNDVLSIGHIVRKLLICLVFSRNGYDFSLNALINGIGFENVFAFAVNFAVYSHKQKHKINYSKKIYI